MEKILKEGIRLYVNKKYLKAFDKFVSCEEFYLAGICQVRLNKINEPINMFVLAIDKYKKQGVVDVNTLKGKEPIIIIYLKLAELLFKTNELQIALGAMVYGLQESECLLETEFNKKAYNSLKNTLDYQIEKTKIVNNKDDNRYDILFDEFSSFLSRKIKFLNKKDQKKSAFITINEYEYEDVEDYYNGQILTDNTDIKNVIIDKELKKEDKDIVTITIMEIKTSVYLRVVRYLYTIDNEIIYFFNKNTKKIECEQVLEDISIKNKNEDDLLSLKKILNTKYKITKDILI